MCHDNEEWWKIRRVIDLLFQNWHEDFDKFSLEHSKVSKNCTLTGFFWPKYIMFEPKNYRGVMVDNSEHWCKVLRKTDLCFQKRHEEFSKCSKLKNSDFILDGKMVELN